MVLNLKKTSTGEDFGLENCTLFLTSPAGQKLNDCIILFFIYAHCSFDIVLGLRPKPETEKCKRHLDSLAEFLKDSISCCSSSLFIKECIGLFYKVTGLVTYVFHLQEPGQIKLGQYL